MAGRCVLISEGRIDVTPFALADLDQEVVLDEPARLVPAVIRSSAAMGESIAGTGESVGASTATFARCVARTAHPVTDGGAMSVNSPITDTTTRCGTPPHSDDSRMDDI